MALAQGAGISTAVPNPDGSKASQSRDFLGEGLGNLAGSFFQSMGTGGSLSRTGISVGAGANSRLGGVFAGLWLGLIVLLFGSQAEKVPLAVIGGMLMVIGVELIMARVPSARLVWSTRRLGIHPGDGHHLRLGAVHPPAVHDLPGRGLVARPLRGGVGRQSSGCSKRCAWRMAAGRCARRPRN